MAKRFVSLTLLMLAFATVAELAHAQTPAPSPPVPAAPSIASTAQALQSPFLASCDAIPALDHLTAAYNSGDWAGFQSDARALLDALRGAPLQPVTTAPALAGCANSVPSDRVTAALDYKRRYVVLVWLGASPLGTTQVMRAVVHLPVPESYSADLPGVTGFTEVFLASSLDARAVSLYTSTREKDPFIEQLPEFVKAIFAPLSTTIAGILVSAQGAIREAGVGNVPKLAVTVSGVVLPIRRASVRAQTKVKDLTSQTDFRDAVTTLGATLLFDGAGRSARARAQVESLVTQLPLNAAVSCGPPAGSSAESPVSRTKDCREALDETLKEAFDKAADGAPAGEVTVIVDVDKQFRTLAVNALSTSAELDMTFKNRPSTRFTFGAGGAVIANARLNRVRTKIDDTTGQLISDPLPRVMTLAFVNWSPAGYDEASADISLSERVRPFFGAALTPDFGVVGGVNVLLARGIGVAGGMGWLFGKGADAEEIGNPPAPREDPFKLAVARSVFVGITYNYK